MSNNAKYKLNQIKRRKARKLHLRRVDNDTSQTKKITPPKASKKTLFWETIAQADRIERIDEQLKAKALMSLPDAKELEKEKDQRKSRIEQLDIALNPKAYLEALRRQFMHNLQLEQEGVTA